MKTSNFSIDLMVPSQLSKDIVFNEALLKIDSFMNCSITDFIDHQPLHLRGEEKYIISSGEHKNKICYRPLESKSVLLHEPAMGMLVFILKGNFFLVYSSNGWEKASISGAMHSGTPPDRFISADKELSLSPVHVSHYLYLNSNTNILIEQRMQPEITIIIKQSSNSSFKINWPPYILWENKNAHTMTANPNSIDLIKLYQLPESQHLLGKIISQNFTY